MNCVSHSVVENLKQFAFKGDKSRVVRRTFWLIKVVPTWKKFEKRWSKRQTLPAHYLTEYTVLQVLIWYKKVYCASGWRWTETIRGLSFVHRSQTGQTSTALKHVIHFNTAYGQWPCASSLHRQRTMSQLPMKCSKGRISLGRSIPRSLTCRLGDKLYAVIRSNVTKRNVGRR
jgi:hypothetical protein